MSPPLDNIFFTVPTARSASSFDWEYIDEDVTWVNFYLAVKSPNVFPTCCRPLADSKEILYKRVQLAYLEVTAFLSQK